MWRFIYGIVFSSIIFCSTQSGAQETSCDNYLITFTLDTICSSILELKKPFGGGKFFRLDDKAIPASDVKFYSDGRDYFANLTTVRSLFSNPFAVRTDVGAINLYIHSPLPPLSSHI